MQLFQEHKFYAGPSRFCSFVLSLLAQCIGCIIGGTGPKPICERFWEDDAVALANVVAIEQTGFQRTALQIVEVFRGNPPSEVTFDDPRTDCGVNFRKRGGHLVWLHKDGDKWIAFDDDDDTEASDQAFARSLPTIPSTARIFGDVGTVRPKYRVIGGPPPMTESWQRAT